MPGKAASLPADLESGHKTLLVGQKVQQSSTWSHVEVSLLTCLLLAVSLSWICSGGRTHNYGLSMWPGLPHKMAASGLLDSSWQLTVPRVNALGGREEAASRHPHVPASKVTWPHLGLPL
jgi:hypothetical protein